MRQCDACQFEATGARKVKPCASKSSLALADCRYFRKAAASGFFELGRQRDGIDDRRMRVFRESADDLHARLGGGVGR